MKKRSTMRRYDLTAKTYDERYAQEQEAKYGAALEGLVVQGVVLDVGCGTGLLFKHVASKAETIVGLDISKQLLLLARERARVFTNVLLVQADADYLPFKDDSFDNIFSFTVLQNLPKPKVILMEMQRTGRKRASIVVTGLKKVFSSEAYGRLLKESDLSIVSIKDDPDLKCFVAFAFKP